MRHLLGMNTFVFFFIDISGKLLSPGLLVYDYESTVQHVQEPRLDL